MKKQMIRIRKDYDILESNFNEMPVPGIEFEIDCSFSGNQKSEIFYIYYNIEDQTWFGYIALNDYEWMAVKDENVEAIVSEYHLSVV